MRILLTGAGGFVGRRLAALLEPSHDLFRIDRDLRGAPGIEGDIADPDFLAAAFEGGCDAVVHLVTLGGAAAEADPSGAFRANVAASVRLAEFAAAAGGQPRFIFASSIAVLGEGLAGPVGDGTPVAPHMLYGAHKAMIETWLETLGRRGDLSTMSVRLPGIVARPAGPSGMKSAFMSNLFHAFRAGRPISLPVSPHATMWLMSVDRAALNLRHALQIKAGGSVTLPALHVTMEALVSAVAAATGQSTDLASYAPDAAIEAAFGALPPLATPLAETLGFAADRDLPSLAQSALETLE